LDPKTNVGGGDAQAIVSAARGFDKTGSLLRTVMDHVPAITNTSNKAT